MALNVFTKCKPAVRSPGTREMKDSIVMWVLGNHNSLTIFSVTCPNLCRASDDDSRSLQHALTLLGLGCILALAAAFVGTVNIGNLKTFPRMTRRNSNIEPVFL